MLLRETFSPFYLVRCFILDILSFVLINFGYTDLR